MRYLLFLPFLFLLIAANYIVSKPHINVIPLPEELHCLALNLYHEARGESDEGMIAVGMVTLNRLRSNKYPDTVCAVIWQNDWSRRHKRYVAQFSWTLDKLSDYPSEVRAWINSITIANNLLAGYYRNPTWKATNYHAMSVSPYWAKELTFITQIGHHRFYY